MLGAPRPTSLMHYQRLPREPNETGEVQRITYQAKSIWQVLIILDSVLLRGWAFGNLQILNAAITHPVSTFPLTKVTNVLGDCEKREIIIRVKIKGAARHRVSKHLWLNILAYIHTHTLVPGPQ